MATPKKPPQPFNSWTPGAGAPPTPVSAELGGTSAPGTAAKPTGPGDTWEGERHLAGTGKISFLNRIIGGIKSISLGEKKKAAVESAQDSRSAVELTPMKNKMPEKTVVPLGGNSTKAVPRLNLGGSPAKGGSRKAKKTSKKTRKPKNAKKIRKTKKTRSRR
jgi:hypothetical protein